jgi:hypothetical protein
MDKKVFVMNLKTWDCFWLLLNTFFFILCNPIAKLSLGIEADVNGYMDNISSSFTWSIILFLFIQADSSMRSSKHTRLSRTCFYIFICVYLGRTLFNTDLCGLKAVDGRTVDMYEFVLFDVNVVNVWNGACANLLVFAVKMLVMSMISPFTKQTLQSPVYFR